MPLPRSSGKNFAWPPTELVRILPTLRQWAAWWSNDLDMLSQAYGGGAIQDSTGFFASDVGGVKPTMGQRFVRWFVGEPVRGPNRNTKLPIPIAAEMAQASADLLFADPVQIQSSHSGTQKRLNYLLNEDVHSTLAQGAESGAALGGVYMRVTWDDTICDGPFLTVRDADSAWPEFRHGHLVAVTFWDVVATVKDKVYRLLERHEIDPVTKNGIVLYGLFMGGDDYLGDQVPLNLTAASAPLAKLITDDLLRQGKMTATLDSKSEGLLVYYVPNQMPNRIWRQHALGRHLGRSDFDGTERLMDQLAETMSAWARAIRLGKARIHVAKELVNSTGPGNGTAIDLDQEAYTTVNNLGGRDVPISEQVVLIQPTINTQAYADTAQTLMEQILQMAGYSMQTFGVGDTGNVRTATEIESRERRSLMTRDRKVREWKPGIAYLVNKMLHVDNDWFNQANKTDDVTMTVQFAENVQQTQLALAETVQALFLSQSASLERRIKIVNPDMDEDDLKKEIKRVRKEVEAANAAKPSGAKPSSHDLIPGGSDGPSNPNQGGE